MFPGNTSTQSYQGVPRPPSPVAHTQLPLGYNEIDKRFNNLEKSQNSLERVMRNYGRTIVTTSHCQQEEGNISSEIEPNLNVGPSSMCPPNQNNVKRVNAITSLRSGRFIDHNLEDLVDVPIELSPSLSPPSLFDNDSASRDASDGNLIDPSPSRPTDLVNLKEIKRDRSKKGDDTSQPLTS